jgi:hypothetical protein
MSSPGQKIGFQLQLLKNPGQANAYAMLLIYLSVFINISCRIKWSSLNQLLFVFLFPNWDQFL